MLIHFSKYALISFLMCCYCSIQESQNPIFLIYIKTPFLFTRI